MSWRRKEPGHQQPWYWLSQTEITRSPHVKGWTTSSGQQMWFKSDKQRKFVKTTCDFVVTTVVADGLTLCARIFAGPLIRPMCLVWPDFFSKWIRSVVFSAIIYFFHVLIHTLKIYFVVRRLRSHHSWWLLHGEIIDLLSCNGKIE